MPTPLSELAASLDLSRSRITNPPQLIFLCGGKISEDKAPPASARDYFLRFIRANAPKVADRIQLAETVNDWFTKVNSRFERSVFTDLLELEEYLADFSQRIILFVESPGSIAELGAFASIDVIRAKTIAIINDAHDHDNTFIADGPVRRIKHHNDEHLLVYPWDEASLSTADSASDLEQASADILAKLEALDASGPTTERLDVTRHRHRAFLISEALRMVGVATLRELQEFTEALELRINKQDVERYLALLETLDYVARKRRSDQNFFISLQTTQTIGFTFRDGASVHDPVRLMTLLRSQLDTQRQSLLRRVLEQGAGVV